MNENTRKYFQDLERYNYIVKYFENRPSRRTKKNIIYLTDLSESLRKDLFSADEIFEFEINKLRTKLGTILTKDLRTKLENIESSRKEKRRGLFNIIRIGVPH